MFEDKEKTAVTVNEENYHETVKRFCDSIYTFMLNGGYTVPLLNEKYTVPLLNENHNFHSVAARYNFQ